MTIYDPHYQTERALDLSARWWEAAQENHMDLRAELDEAERDLSWGGPDPLWVEDEYRGIGLYLSIAESLVNMIEPGLVYRRHLRSLGAE